MRTPTGIARPLGPVYGVKDCELDPIPGVAAPMNTVDGIQECTECQLYDCDLEAAAALARHVPGGGVVKFIQDETYEVRIYDRTREDDCIATPSDPWVEDARGRIIDWQNTDLWAEGGPSFAYVEVTVEDRLADQGWEASEEELLVSSKP